MYFSLYVKNSIVSIGFQAEILLMKQDLQKLNLLKGLTNLICFIFF